MGTGELAFPGTGQRGKEDSSPGHRSGWGLGGPVR